MLGWTIFTRRKTPGKKAVSAGRRRLCGGLEFALQNYTPLCSGDIIERVRVDLEDFVMQPHVNQGVERRFILSLVITSLLFIGQLIGSFWTGSLALLSDSAHVFMDVFALGLSYLALRLSALPPNDRHTYGYHRLEVLAALVNGISLAAIALGIWWESYQRLLDPPSIRSVEMLVIAVAGLVVNLLVAFVLGGHAHSEEAHTHLEHDLNLQSAFLHVVGDAASSVGVILAAVIIWQTGWKLADPLASVLIGGMILSSAYRVTRKALHILVEGVPEGLSTQDIQQSLRQVPEVRDVHDLHVWSICSGHVALSAHVILQNDPPQNPDHILNEINGNMRREFGIEHTTIQFEEALCESEGQPCN